MLYTLLLCSIRLCLYIRQSDLECPPVSFIFSCKGLSFIWPSVSLQLLLHSRVSKDLVSQRASDGSDQFLWTNYKPYHFKTINWFYLFVYLFILKWKSIAKVSWKWWIWCLHYVTSLLKPCDSFLWESDQNVSYLLSLGIQPDFLWHTHESKMLLENAALNWLFINRSN